MDPLTAVTAGRAAVGRRFAFYLSVQLASVMAPGVVAVTCLTALLLRSRDPLHPAKAAGRAISTLHGPTAILVDVSWLAAAYVIGYVGRELAFRALGAAERLSRRHRAALSTLRTDLEVVYGAEAVGRCLRTHPLLRRLLDAAGRPVAPSQNMRQPGGALLTGNAYEAFNYAKSWLRTHNPGLAPDAVEAEINVLLSTLLPIILGTWTLIALVSPGVEGAAVVVLAAGTVTALVFTQVLRLRRVEGWQALRDLLEDHEMRLAAHRLPAAAGSPSAASDEESSGPSPGGVQPDAAG